MHPILKSHGITTPEAATALASEMRKAANGEYGLYDMSLNGGGGRYMTATEVAGQYGIQKDASGAIQKDSTNQIGVVTGLGLLGVPLEVPAKLLTPFPTLLVNRIPRKTIGGSTVTFRKITAVNSQNVWPSVSEASDSTTGRNTRIARNEANVTYNFKSFEMEDMITPEAIFGSNSKMTPGQDFQAEDFARLTLLLSTKVAEEKVMLGGNVTLLAAVTTPTIASPVGLATTLGSLTAATAYYIRVSALTLQGWLLPATGHASADALGETPATNEMTRTTASGGATGDVSINVQWNAVPGAVAYNVYVGTTTGNANCQYVGTVTTTACTIISTTLLAATYNSGVTTATDVHSTNVGNTADKTAKATDYDGLIAQCTKSAFGPGYYKGLADGATLTTDLKGGIQEFDDAFRYEFDHYKVGFDEIFVNSAQKEEIDRVSVGSTAPIYRIDVKAGDLNVTGSLGFRDANNRYMGNAVPVTVHPFLPPGTILFVSYALGPYYSGSNVGENIVMYLGWDYRSITFGMVKRAVELGIDWNGALVVYAPFALGAIQGVA